MKHITISLAPKELEILKDILRYEIETRGLDISNTINTHPEDLLWMTENAYNAASLLHKIHTTSPEKKGKK
jgi:hypothetical protein